MTKWRMLQIEFLSNNNNSSKQSLGWDDNTFATTQLYTKIQVPLKNKTPPFLEIKFTTVKELKPLLTTNINPKRAQNGNNHQ